MSDAACSKRAPCGARFEVSDWKPHSKNKLQAFLNLSLPSGMTINGCGYHRKNDGRWIGLPNQKFTKADGSVSYTPIIEFTSDDARRRFQEQAIAAVDRYVAERKMTVGPRPEKCE